MCGCGGSGSGATARPPYLPVASSPRAPLARPAPMEYDTPGPKTTVAVAAPVPASDRNPPPGLQPNGMILISLIRVERTR